MSFDTIIGHTRAKKFLTEATRNQRVSHAYLFHGPMGVGKRTLSRALARNLFCSTNQPGENSCGHCANCLKVDSHNHPDISIPKEDPEKGILNIAAIRELQEEVHKTSVEGRGKVFLVRHVHRLREDTVNALLKTLEEPPPGSILILTATDLLMVKDTIRSRCQAVKLGPVPLNDLRTFLEQDQELSAHQSELLSRICGGSPGACVAFLKGGFLNQLTDHEAIWLGPFLGQKGTAVSHLLNLAKEAAGSTPSETRMWIQTALHLGLSFLRDLLILSDGIDPSQLRHVTSEACSGGGLPAAANVIDLIEEVLFACGELDRNLNPAVILADLEVRVRSLAVPA